MDPIPSTFVSIKNVSTKILEMYFSMGKKNQTKKKLAIEIN